MGRTFTLTPEAKNINNPLDHLGLLLGLPRLPDEGNSAYRRRLWDVYVRRASATERGLVNGITRELGLEQYQAVTISYVGSSSNYPRVVVQDVQVELYSNWNLLDESVDADTTEGFIKQLHVSTKYVSLLKANKILEQAGSTSPC